MQANLNRLNKDLIVVRTVTLINSIMLSLLLVWSFVKPTTTGNIATATGGSAAANLSINSASAEALAKAKSRGYFTAKEYAEFQGVNLETVYRRLDSGLVPNAEKVNHRWHIPLH